MIKLVTLLLIFILGCSNTASPSAIETSQLITGTLNYIDKLAPPTNTKLTIQLYDVSLMDAPAALIADTQQTFSYTSPMQIPFNFEINYLEAKIDSRHSYSVQAMIVANDEIIFTSTSAYPVITKGNGKKVDITLQSTKNNRAMEYSEKVVEYSCDRNTNITVSFTSKKQENILTSIAIINSQNNQAIILAAKQVGSGFLYSNGKYSLRGKDNQVQWTIGRMIPLSCTITKNK